MIDAEVQGSKVFFGARRPAELSYVVGGSRPATVQVELVRAADGAVVQQWAPGEVAPGVAQTVRWDGTVAGEVQRDGLYQFRVTATDSSGVPPRRARPGAGGARSARRPRQRAGEVAAAAPGAFTFLRYRFPLVGAHDYAEAAGRFGGGRGHQGQDVFAACGTPIVAARGGVVKFKEFQSRGRQLRRDRRRADRRRLRLHAPARGGAGRAWASASGPGSRSASSAPPAARAAATCTSRSGPRRAGTAAAARSTRCPTCAPGTTVLAGLAAALALAPAARRGVVLRTRASTRKTSTAPITPVTMPGSTWPRIALLTAYATPNSTATIAMGGGLIPTRSCRAAWT